MASPLKPLNLAPHSIEDFGEKILIRNLANQQTVVARSTYKDFLGLMDSRRTFAEVLSAFHGLGHPMWLREMSRLLEQLQNHEILLSGAPETFDREAATKSKYGLRLIPAKQVIAKTRLLGVGPLSLFFFILVFAGLGGLRLWIDLTPFNFLSEIANPIVFPIALWAVAFLFSQFRSLVLVVLSLLSTGRIPSLWICNRRGLFFLTVATEEIKLLNRAQQGFAWMSTALSPLLFYGLAASFLPESILSFIGWICLFCCICLTNPFSQSDFRRLINQIVSPEEDRHLIPFLRSKVLNPFLRKGSNIPGEIRLLLYATFAMGWLYFIVSVGLSVLTANIGPWVQQLREGDLGARLKTVEIVFLWLVPNLMIAAHFLNLVYNHARFSLRPWFRKRPSPKTASLPQPSKEAQRAQLQNITFFNSLSAAKLDQLILESECFSARQGSLLISQGDFGNDLFVLLQGQLRVSRQLETGLVEVLTHLHENAIFGDVGESEELFRRVDVHVVESAVILKFQRSSLQRLLDVPFDSKEVLPSMKNQIALARALGQSALFKDLPRELTNLFLAPSVEFLHVSPGRKIIIEGQESDDFYFIIDGEVTVSRGKQILAVLAAGHFFGEMALLQSRKRTADVTAKNNCMLLKLPATVFYEILSRNWGLALHFDLIATQRGAVAL